MDTSWGSRSVTLFYDHCDLDLASVLSCVSGHLSRYVTHFLFSPIIKKKSSRAGLNKFYEKMSTHTILLKIIKGPRFQNASKISSNI